MGDRNLGLIDNNNSCLKSSHYQAESAHKILKKPFFIVRMFFFVFKTCLLFFFTALYQHIDMKKEYQALNIVYFGFLFCAAYFNIPYLYQPQNVAVS